MLDSFLETNIQNKLKFFSILHSQSSVSVKELTKTLKLSLSGITSLVDELNSDFQGIAEVERKLSRFSLSIYENINFFKSFHSIYKNSSVLHCLKFMINNDSHKSFSKFMENEFLTKSSAYRIRQNCRDYLHNIGLDIKENKIIGEEYRIRFLIALLYYKYGIDCCGIDEESRKLARNFILSTNNVISMNYLEQTINEYGYFECLFILSWKRKKYPVSFSEPNNFEKLKELFVYNETKKALRGSIEPMLNIEFSEEDYDYIYLVFCCTNNCIFADKWSQEDIEQVHNIIFSNKTFSDLLQRFEDKFGKEVVSSYALRATLIYFYKKCLLELQCIIPDKHFYIESKKSYSTLAIVECLSDILNSWREANNIKYKIDNNHLFYLALQTKFILHQFMKPIQVFILADLTAELEVMSLYLSRNFSTKRITITPVLINAQDKNFLYSQKDSIFIVHKKFVSIVNSLGLAKQNIVVPVTIEINEREINDIQKAIERYEKKFF